jgi:hypothetical protein
MNQEISMKQVALVLGVLSLLLGIAGFAGLYAANAVHSAIYAGVGLLGVMYGLTHRRELMPPHSAGRDMRDLGGV